MSLWGLWWGLWACRHPAPEGVSPPAPVAAIGAPEQATGCRTGLAPSVGAGMVVSAHPEASRIGADVLAKGGTAVDAAVAVAVALTLVEPQSSGLGGGGFMVHYDAATRSVAAYDGRETAPATAGADLFVAEGGARPWPEVVPGGLSVGTPGLVRMLELAHRAHGRLAWSELLLPTAELAEAGFAITERMSRSIEQIDATPMDSLRRDPVANAYTHRDGRALPPGTLLTNPALAATVRELASAGPDAFYEGPLAEAIVDAVASSAQPGELSLDDLRRYRAVTREAVCLASRGREICGHPPPTSGGVTVLQILGITERAEQERLHELVEAERLAWADRERYLADPDALHVPVEELLAPAYLDRRAAAVGVARGADPAPGDFPVGAPHDGLCAEGEHTSHVVVADAAGNVVSMTNSIENAWGSGVMVGGFLLNNELTDFALDPRGPDGSLRANAPAACKRPRSSMAPLLVIDEQGVELAIGSPGGSRIIGYVAQAVVDVLDEGLPLQEALSRPRVVARGASVEVEAGCGDAALADAMSAALGAAGHAVERVELNSGLHALQRGPAGWIGAVDPRRDGLAVGVPAER